MEPRDHGLEYEEDVRPQPRLTRPCAAWRRESRRLPVNRGEITTRSGRHQTSGGSWQRQNRPRRSATKPQSDGLLGLDLQWARRGRALAPCKKGPQAAAGAVPRRHCPARVSLQIPLICGDPALRHERLKFDRSWSLLLFFPRDLGQKFRPGHVRSGRSHNVAAAGVVLLKAARRRARA